MSSMSSACSPSPSLSSFQSCRPTKMSFSSSQGKCNAHSRPLSDFARICLYSFSPFVSLLFHHLPHSTTSDYNLSSIFIIFCKNIFEKGKGLVALVLKQFCNSFWNTIAIKIIIWVDCPECTFLTHIHFGNNIRIF